MATAELVTMLGGSSGLETISAANNVAGAIYGVCEAASKEHEHAQPSPVPLAVPPCELEQVLETIRIGAIEAESPSGGRPPARELQPSRPPKLVEEGDRPERPVRIRNRELDGVLLNARPGHGAEDTRYADS